MPKWVLTTTMVFCSALVTVSVVKRSSDFKVSNGTIPVDKVLQRICNALMNKHYKPSRQIRQPRKAGSADPMGYTPSAYGDSRSDTGVIPPTVTVSQEILDQNGESRTITTHFPGITNTA